MATIKSNTDLEQSKKLAEILPPESADNVIVSFGSREGTKNVVMPKETLDVFRTPFADIRETTMCWSLAALLNVLPYPSLAQHANGLWSLVAWVDKVDPYSVGDSVCGYDNEIDACVAMIEKLHELKML